MCEEGEGFKRRALSGLRERFGADPKWYPGKDEDEDVSKGGRPKVITGQQEHAIATSAMAMKERGLVPSVSAILASCPQATLNPETDEPFSAKVILRVFKTKCYDQDPEHPWKYDHPKQKSTLSPEAMGARLKWSDDMLEINHQADWYFRHIAWVDPCYTIVPGRPKTIHDQMVASFGKAKRWSSDDSKDEPKNLRSRHSGVM